MVASLVESDSALYLLTEELKRLYKTIPVATNYHDLLVSVQPLPIHKLPHTIAIRCLNEDEKQARPDPGQNSDRRGPTTCSVDVDQLTPINTDNLIPTK